MKVRFSILVAIAAVTVLILWYVGWLVSNQILYKQQAQPIAFPHDLHAGTRGIACQYCHRGVEKNFSAGVPSVQECMDCHRAIPTLLPAPIGKADPAQHPEIAKLVNTYWIGEGGTFAKPNPKPIQWWKVYELPDHARFPHAAHINKGFACTECHGDVKTMREIKPQQNIGMGWCISCHRGNNSLKAKGPQQCSSCHY